MAYSKQTWENLPNQTTPITAERLNYMENGIYEASIGTSIEVYNDYNTSTTDSYSCNYVNGLNGKILWTNPNPTSAFTGQTITLSSDDYDMLEIFYYDYLNTNNMYSTKFQKGNSGNLMAMFQYNNHGYIGNRIATYNSDISYTFSNGITIVQSDSFNRAGASDWCVPLYIIGYKTGLFD